MTAAVYRWLSEAGALLLAASGAGLVAWGLCALCVLVGLVIAGVQYTPLMWAASRRKAAQIRSCLARWHAAQVRRASEPVPYGQHDAAAWRLPLLAELAIVALIVGLMVTCGVAR